MKTSFLIGTVIGFILMGVIVWLAMPAMMIKKSGCQNN